MLEKRQQFAQALAFLDANCKIEQLPAEILVELGFSRSELKLALKDIQGAREALQETLRIPGRPAPWVAECFTRMAKFYYMQKRYQEAQSLMRRARAVRGHEWGYDSAFHKEVDQLVAQQNKERAIRERKARQEQERKLRMERQRKQKLERERQKLERERKARKNSK